MLPLALFGSLDNVLKKSSMHELLAYNTELKKHGLVLTPVDAEEIIDARSRALKNQGRVELDTSVTKELVKRLSESAYINQENYVRTITELYETFHFIKNATSDFTSDQDIVDAIMVYFEKVCGGSAELLMGKGVEKITENFISQNVLTDIEKEEDEEYWYFDE